LISSLEAQNITMEVAPGEAHTRLGIVERRHMVLRSAVEGYMQSENLPSTVEGVRDAVSRVAPLLNTLAFNKGYTPAQWVLNTNPEDPSKILSDDFNPALHHNAVYDPTFEEELRRRMAARIAFVKADADQRIRRALLRRHRTLRMPLAVGQSCFFWREAGVPRLQKNRWRGPATVVMREDDPTTGKPTVYCLYTSRR